MEMSHAALCDKVGGKCFTATSLKARHADGLPFISQSKQALNQHLEQLSLRIRPGVAVSFDALPDEPGSGLADEMLRLGPSHHQVMLLKPAPKGGFAGNWVRQCHRVKCS